MAAVTAAAAAAAAAASGSKPPTMTTLPEEETEEAAGAADKEEEEIKVRDANVQVLWHIPVVQKLPRLAAQHLFLSLPQNLCTRCP